MGIMEVVEYLFGKDRPDRQCLRGQGCSPSNGENRC